MATLTEAAYYSRNIIKFGVIGIVTLLILRSLVIAGVAYWRKTHPPPPPPPTVLFGKLPALEFVENDYSISSFKLETVTSSTPYLGDRAKVFFMPIRQASLLGLERMEFQASKLGFSGEPEQLSPRRYQWTKDRPLPTTLIADIISGSFSLDVTWQQNSGLLSQKNLPDRAEAIAEAQSILHEAELLPEDLINSGAKVSFLKADVGEMVPAISLSEADFVRVDFFRSPIEEMLVYAPNPKRGVVSLTFSGSKTAGKRVVELKYNYFRVNYEQSATYPLKTSQTAWNELQSGAGYVAYVDKEVKTAVVRKITLGYFDSAVPQHYLQPVYVFEGDGSFVGYVAAVDALWIE